MTTELKDTVVQEALDDTMQESPSTEASDEFDDNLPALETTIIKIVDLQSCSKASSFTFKHAVAGI
jgi:hypothetical protein